MSHLAPTAHPTEDTGQHQPSSGIGLMIVCFGSFFDLQLPGFGGWYLLLGKAGALVPMLLLQPL